MVDSTYVGLKKAKQRNWIISRFLRIRIRIKEVSVGLICVVARTAPKNAFGFLYFQMAKF